MSTYTIEEAVDWLTDLIDNGIGNYEHALEIVSEKTDIDSGSLIKAFEETHLCSLLAYEEGVGENVLDPGFDDLFVDDTSIFSSSSFEERE